MILERLVGDVATLQKVWEDRPAHFTGLGAFDDVFNLGLAEDLIVSRGLRLPYLRLVRDGSYLPVARFTHRTGTGAGSADGVADPDAVLREIHAGATVVLRGLTRYCPTVADVCHTLSGELGFDTSAGAYLTPAHARGAGLHFDPMSVLVRQVHGVKHWRIHAPEHRWPVGPPQAGGPPVTPVVMELSLGPGDCLYLPRGYLHDAWTTDEMSVHITFSGDVPPTWVDVAHLLVDQAAADERLREGLPWRFDAEPDALLAQVRDKLDVLRELLATVDPGTLAAGLATRHGTTSAPSPRGQLATMLRRPGTTGATGATGPAG
ncbi:JmjC domain-containing protein [Parafrankia sp. FMc2]|uniref:JmjC domain-containing protein n=1 Tax=Parafrankia sp. FMc2 TaxID=3233196 RepID=UPI0034D7056E